MMHYIIKIIMFQIIKVIFAKLKRVMQPTDRDEIIFRNRFDKKMQKLFTTLPKHICKKYKIHIDITVQDNNL